MKKREGRFSLSDNVFDPPEQDLVEQFLQVLSRRYQIDLSDSEFRFQGIGVGLSKSSKVLALSDDFYPYFLKISDVASINKEVSNLNRASTRIPPLHIPPLETVVSSENPKFARDANRGFSLLAVRYISDSAKGEKPLSLFEEFPKLDVYASIAIIDELFQVVFRDLHAFHKLKPDQIKPFEHFQHDEELFSKIRNATLTSMVKRYNEFVATARTCDLPHGLLHGDLHCQNIILNSRKMPLIIDFEMMRLDGCLLNDFAEFEVALLVAALDSDVVKFGPSIRGCYRGATLFEFFGVDKITRSVRSIRTNLAHNLFNIAELDPSKSFMAEFDYIYRVLLLRYICSYAWVSQTSMSEKSSLVVIGVLSNIFDQLYENLTQSGNG
jgi:hypothetical protein